MEKNSEEISVNSKSRYNKYPSDKILLIFTGIFIPIKVKYEIDDNIVSIGDLRPNESLTISFLVKGSFRFMSLYDLEKMRITSDEHIAVWAGAGTGETWNFIYKVGFWGFIIISILSLVSAALNSYLAKKETTTIPQTTNKML